MDDACREGISGHDWSAGYDWSAVIFERSHVVSCACVDTDTDTDTNPDLASNAASVVLDNPRTERLAPWAEH